MNQAAELEFPCMEFTGEYVEFNGREIPIYCPSERKDGKPSINTLEGWNRLSYEQAVAVMTNRLNRQPTQEEVDLQIFLRGRVTQRLIKMAQESAGNVGTECPIGADDERGNQITCPECILQNSCPSNPENNGDFETDDEESEGL